MANNGGRLGIEIDGAKVYRLDEAAQLLGVHPRTLSRQIREGHLKAGKVGRRYFISGHALLDLCGAFE